MRAAVDATVAAFGRLDTVVANAGFATHDDLADGDPAGWRDMVLTNVLGPALLIRAALPALRQTRGRIVLIGSVAGVIHTPGQHLRRDQWAVTGLAENTRLLVTDDGIGVTLIVAGPRWTPLLRRRSAGRRTARAATSRRPARRVDRVGDDPAAGRRRQHPDGPPVGSPR